MAVASSKSVKEPSLFDAEEYAELIGERMGGARDLVDWLYAQQEAIAGLIPPGLDVLQQPGTSDVVVIDLNARTWESGFLEALAKIVPTHRYSVPTYDSGGPGKRSQGDS